MPSKKDDDICQVTCVHKNSINKVKENILPTAELQDLANLFKVLGDHTRIRIINALYHSELCVCDLVDLLEMNQPAISHQLRILRTSKVVKYRKEGKNVFYSLVDQHIFSLLDIGTEHIQEENSSVPLSIDS